MNDLTDVKLFLASLIEPMVFQAVKAGLAANQPQSQTAAEADEPLTPEEAAQLFKTSKVTIWSWEKKGLFKGHHLGNKKYFLRSELMAALTKKEANQSINQSK